MLRKVFFKGSLEDFEGLGFRVSCLGFRVWGFGFRVSGLGVDSGVSGFGFRVWGWTLGHVRLFLTVLNRDL